jgi:hypothetical protein
MCDEDPEDVYILDVACTSIEHLIMIPVSTIGLIVFFSFIIAQRVLFNSTSFDNDVPWSSLQADFDLLKLVVKLIQSAGFVFDKQGNYLGYINVICFALNSGIVFSRVTRAVMIHRSVYYATLMYESMLSWLWLTIGIQKLGGFDIVIYQVVLYFICGILLGLILLV